MLLLFAVALLLLAGFLLYYAHRSLAVVPLQVQQVTQPAAPTVFQIEFSNGVRDREIAATSVVLQEGYFQFLYGTAFLTVINADDVFSISKK